MVRLSISLLTVCCAIATASWGLAQDRPLDLSRLVEPSAVLNDGDQRVRFALHGFIEFESLEELFSHIDERAGHWQFDSVDQRNDFAEGLLRRGVESRLISMTYQKPHEILVTHTAEQLAAAVDGLRRLPGGLLFEGRNWRLDAATYRTVLLDLQRRWKGSINCWSASPSVAGRVLSNWYIIDEGITLFGADYDSTEHFWQAVKYHPDVSLEDLSEILERLRKVSWLPWVERLGSDQAVYLAHGYSVEFLRRNLSPDRLNWFAARIADLSSRFGGGARQLQQRDPAGLRFTALEEKILWGDLADVLHLLYFFSRADNARFRTSEMDPALESITRHHFDAIYLDGYAGGKVSFISPEFRQLMLEIWRTKFLEMERFREVLRSTEGRRLLHFLNDGDSPDIPISIYVGMLEDIRRLALQ